MINIKNITFSYDGEGIFDDFSLVLSGPIDVIQGHSGCGKTTLLKIICGYISYRYGEISPNPQEIQSQAILILQQDSLIPWLTGRENIKRFLKGPSGYQENLVAGHPLYFLIEDYLDRLAYSLSFGQRRTLELFRAFYANPPVLLLDEPYNYLDIDRRKIFTKYIEEKSADIHIIATTHEISDFKGVAINQYVFPENKPLSNLEMVEQ